MSQHPEASVPGHAGSTGTLTLGPEILDPRRPLRWGAGPPSAQGVSLVSDPPTAGRKQGPREPSCRPRSLPVPREARLSALVSHLRKRKTTWFTTCSSRQRKSHLGPTRRHDPKKMCILKEVASGAGAGREPVDEDGRGHRPPVQGPLPPPPFRPERGPRILPHRKR